MWVLCCGGQFPNIPVSLDNSHSINCLCLFIVTLRGYNWKVRWDFRLEFLTNELRGFRPRGNYTDRANAACRRNLCQICGLRVLSCQYNESLQPYSRFYRPEPLLLIPSSSSIVLTRLSGPRSRPTTSQTTHSLDINISVKRPTQTWHYGLLIAKSHIVNKQEHKLRTAVLGL
jgi:hypothetical protein